MTVSFYAKRVSYKDRMINSYYVHTWASLDIDVSVDVSSDQEVTLNIDASKEEKSWQLYSYVTFDF